MKKPPTADPADPADPSTSQNNLKDDDDVTDGAPYHFDYRDPPKPHEIPDSLYRYMSPPRPIELTSDEQDDPVYTYTPLSPIHLDETKYFVDQTPFSLNEVEFHYETISEEQDRIHRETVEEDRRKEQELREREKKRAYEQQLAEKYGKVFDSKSQERDLAERFKLGAEKSSIRRMEAYQQELDAISAAQPLIRRKTSHFKFAFAEPSDHEDVDSLDPLTYKSHPDFFFKDIRKIYKWTDERFTREGWMDDAYRRAIASVKSTPESNEHMVKFGFAKLKALELLSRKMQMTWQKKAKAKEELEEEVRRSKPKLLPKSKPLRTLIV